MRKPGVLIQVEETMYRSILAVLSIALLAACSTVGNTINPYKSNFNCPYKESGKCISMTGAYDECPAVQPATANATAPGTARRTLATDERREGLSGGRVQEARRSPR